MADLIDRQAAIEVVDAMWAVTGDVNVAKVWQQIKDLPSADVQPVRHGHWIDETFKPTGLVFHPYVCDQCGCHSESNFTYCPDCGARMG